MAASPNSAPENLRETLPKGAIYRSAAANAKKKQLFSKLRFRYTYRHPEDPS
jgi:hypothetical protein